MLTPFILAALIAVAAIAVSTILCNRTSGEPETKKAKKKQAILFSVIAMAAQCLLFVLLIVVHHICMAGFDFRLPSSVVILLSVCIQTAGILHTWCKREVWRKIGKHLAVLCVVLFALEIALFNGKSFTTDYQAMYISANYLEFENETGVSYTDGAVIISENADVRVANLPEWVNAVSLDLEQDEHQRPFKVCISIQDDNFSTAYQTVGAKLTSAYGEDVNFTIKPYGELHSLQMSFSEMMGPVKIHSITVMSGIPFAFSALRYFVLFFLIGLVILIKEFRLAYIVYDHRNLNHRRAVLAVIMLCVLSSLLFLIPNQQLIEYPENFNAEYADPYSQTLDAWESGHPWINVPIDPNLETLGEQVYDRNVRDASGYLHAWDRAYYNGKFYSYFGIAPVLTFYYPVYWITGSLPTLYHSCFFFSSLAIVFLCLAILAMVRHFAKKPNLLLLLLSLPAATALCGAYYCMQFPNIYNVVVASGLCFLFLALWLGFQACLTEKKASRLLLFALCGAACVLCVASRPSMALGALILAPVFLGVLLNKQQPLKYRLTQAASFLIPVVIGAVGLMYYNYIRFDSFTDFGASYQLTISNINANHLRLSVLPASFYHYFLQFPNIKNVFPFFTFSYHVLDNYQMYNYQEKCMGILMFPMILFGVLLLPKVLRSRRNVGGTATRLQTKAFLACCFLLAVLIAWMDLSLGGVSIRYMMDFVSLLIFGSIIVMLCTATTPARYTYQLSAAAILAAFVMMWLLMLNISMEGLAMTTLPSQHPMLHEILEELIVFWE